jgi:4a-hydroxytetrahydrobiopterin dehydratase
MGKLSEAEVASKTGSVPDWKRTGAEISRTFQFKDFAGAMRFVNAVAGEAEKANHHPDIDIRWNKVKLTLSTHDAGGLTEKDFALAQVSDKLAKSHA